jgi:hypothetical protein
MREIVLMSSKYLDMINCLTSLAEICTDADIKQGVIRQRSNSNTAVFDIDLSSLIEDIDIPLIQLKNKLVLLKTFVGQSDVSLVLNDDGSFIFSDQYSSLKIEHPEVEFMENKFMTVEERENIFNLDEDEFILSCDIPPIVTERIKVVTRNFNIPTIQVKFNKDIASIEASTQSKDQLATFIKEMNLNMEIENAFSNVPVIPFLMEHDTDVIFSMYKDPNQNVALNRFETKLGEDIEINVYSRSSIIMGE